MKITIHELPATKRAPKGARAPWLSGRGTRWQLVTPFVLDIDGRIYIVPAGYVFDGASIPWWLWMIWPKTYGPSWYASCFHDYCYSHLYKNGITKDWADEAFRAIMLVDGAKPWVADKFYWAVRNFGRGGWDANA